MHVIATPPWGPVPPAPSGRSWEGLMDACLAEAARAATLNEIPVGAVVVHRDGRIVGRGHNAPQGTHDPSAHAEVLALRQAGHILGNYRLEDCVLVVTLEPCLMCVGAVVHARISGVVYGAADPKTGAVHSCLDGFELPFHNHRVWHLGGIRAAACAALLQRFFVQQRSAEKGRMPLGCSKTF